MKAGRSPIVRGENQLGQLLLSLYYRVFGQVDQVQKGFWGRKGKDTWWLTGYQKVN